MTVLNKNDALNGIRFTVTRDCSSNHVHTTHSPHSHRILSTFFAPYFRFGRPPNPEDPPISRNKAQTTGKTHHNSPQTPKTRFTHSQVVQPPLLTFGLGRNTPERDPLNPASTETPTKRYSSTQPRPKHPQRGVLLTPSNHGKSTERTLQTQKAPSSKGWGFDNMPAIT
jgi:hypothetical protein